MPARLTGRAACALRDQAQARRLPGLCRQLQPPPFSQIKRTGDLYHHERDHTVPERLFGHGKRVGLVLRPRDQNTRGIADRRKAHGVKRSGLPTLTHPEQMSLALRAGDHGKAGRTRSADLMNAGGTQGRRGVRCRGHGLKLYHIRKDRQEHSRKRFRGMPGRGSCRSRTTSAASNPQPAPRMAAQVVGTVPPSMTTSLPVIAPASGEAVEVIMSGSSRIRPWPALKCRSPLPAPAEVSRHAA